MTETVVVSLTENQYRFLSEAAEKQGVTVATILKGAGLMYAEVILDPGGNAPYGKPVVQKQRGGQDGTV